MAYHSNYLERFQSFLADFVFPSTCVSCGADGVWLCGACFSNVRFHKLPLEASAGCDTVLALGSYTDPILRACVTRTKYQSARCLLPVLQNLIRAYRAQFREAWPWAGLTELCIVPIPTDPGHVRERGIDHALELAHLVQKELAPWATLATSLKRTRSTLPNATLPADALRQANVAGAFEVGPLPVKNVLLVDDVFTTGATVQEAVRVLREKGTERIMLFVLAAA